MGTAPYVLCMHSGRFLKYLEGILASTRNRHLSQLGTIAGPVALQRAEVLLFGTKPNIYA